MAEEQQKRRKPKSAKRRNELPRRKAAARPQRNLLGDEIHEYSQADLTRLFRLPASLVSQLARARYITTSTGEGKTSYSFQDLLILRTASALKAADISNLKIVAALGHIRSTLPPGSLLTTLASAASSTDLALRPGDAEWVLQSGQVQPLVGRNSSTGNVHTLHPIPTRPAAHLQAESHYARGHALEDSDVAAARTAYLDALNAHSDHLDARINLGRLLHLDGELKEAEKVYRAAKNSSALLSFNLAILLEDLNREEEAIAAYREALAQDPSLHDAHFNLSRLHERAKQPKDALRHLLAYRRHMSRHEPG